MVGPVDVDAYVAAHQHQWTRLEELVGRRRLSGAEADEVLDLYQRVSTHLSRLRSAAPDPSLVAHLSVLLAQARARSASARSGSWADLRTFFTRTFPATLYLTRRWWLAVMAVNVLVALAVGWWFIGNPQIESSLMTPDEVDQLVNSDFASYYSENAAGNFALRVWTNNAWVAALCIALGVLGFPVIQLLWTNVLNVAAIGAIMVHHGRADVFFGLILPHGILELTAVFVAGGVGLRVFWAWIDPGPLSRPAAVAAQFRSAVSVALGLIVVLFVSGLIEAFVTPSPLPTWARIGIGVLAEIAFLSYVFGYGRQAAREGVSGDLDEADRGADLPTVA